MNGTRSQINVAHRENILLYIVSLTIFVDIKMCSSRISICSSPSEKCDKIEIICIYCLKRIRMLNYRTNFPLKKLIH